MDSFLYQNKQISGFVLKTIRGQCDNLVHDFVDNKPKQPQLNVLIKWLVEILTLAQSNWKCSAGWLCFKKCLSKKTIYRWN